MGPIEVKVSDLKTALGENRDQHAQVFQEAWRGYEKALLGTLEDMQRRVSRGKRVDLYELIKLPVPKNHTRDYDTVLHMLDLHQQDTYELDEEDFRRYVEDDWDWKREFITTASNYTRAV